jgi:diaminohydroxyphosphoribosylaminopyrimidine deaminase/5-amino-6-(5-phosphoribosylamino)uracil reductase
MAAAIRLARRNLGATGTNPSVGCLIVRDGVIVGRGVTAPGGRPHAEPIALAEAGENARGATAYVTLEPCAHHGRTPPCAQTLIDAGVARVVAPGGDPDDRVSGKGYDMLRAAGIEVVTGVCTKEAEDDLAGYLIRNASKRPEVILKLAISADGFLGTRGRGQVAITGPVARAQVQLLRASCDAILVGIATAIVDDPRLTVRLPGLADRSPVRIVLDRDARLPLGSKLVASAHETPVWVAAAPDAPAERLDALRVAGCRIVATEIDEGRIALPELLEDLGAQGMMRLLVEGGAEIAASFLAEGLVDRLIAIAAPAKLDAQDGVVSPVKPEGKVQGFRLVRDLTFGEDRWREFRKVG